MSQNGTPLTKEGLAWLIIRGIGVVVALRLALSLVVFLFGMKALPLGSVFDKLSLAVAAAFLCQLAVAVYFLRYGNFVFDLLMLESPFGRPLRPAKPPVIEDPATTLTPAETEAFEAWLEENPDLKKRGEIDQVALFRDHQRRGD